MAKFKTRAVLFKEKSGPHSCYIVAGLDYDVVAQGRTKEGAIRSFYLTFLVNITLEDNSDIKKAPKCCWDLYERATDIETPQFVEKIDMELREINN